VNGELSGQTSAFVG